MYICLCNGYRESELRDMARKGFSVAEEAYEALGDGPCCGQCVDFAQEVMNEERAAPCSSRGVAADMSEGNENRPTDGIPAGPVLNDAAA